MMPTPPLRILFAGSGEFGLPTLKALLDAGHEIAHVYTQPDRPAGRGRTLTPTPIAQFAPANSLPLSRTANLNAEVLATADLMIVIAFGQKISESAAHHPRLGSINLHASRLPKYRGAAPINWAILQGESVTGNSVIRLAARMDAGAILGQSSVEIGETETAGELHDRLALDGGPLVLQVIAELAEGRAIELPQDDSLASSAPKLSRQQTQIDWSQPAAEIARQIRGLYPWPGCRVRLVAADGRETVRLTLARARQSAGSSGTPGYIDDRGHIIAGDGSSVEIVELQPEGKRVMPLADFRRGHAWERGTRLESIIN
jgi:methionyl-tRNA formyltransferase